MTKQNKEDLKYLIYIVIGIAVLTSLYGCASLRDYSEWKNKRDLGCGYCCPPAFGNAFTEGK